MTVTCMLGTVDVTRVFWWHACYSNGEMCGCMHAIHICCSSGGDMNSACMSEVH